MKITAWIDASCNFNELYHVESVESCVDEMGKLFGPYQSHHGVTAFSSVFVELIALVWKTEALKFSCFPEILNMEWELDFLKAFKDTGFFLVTRKPLFQYLYLSFLCACVVIIKDVKWQWFIRQHIKQSFSYFLFYQLSNDIYCFVQPDRLFWVFSLASAIFFDYRIWNDILGNTCTSISFFLIFFFIKWSSSSFSVGRGGFHYALMRFSKNICPSSFIGFVMIRFLNIILLRNSEKNLMCYLLLLPFDTWLMHLNLAGSLSSWELQFQYLPGCFVLYMWLLSQSLYRPLKEYLSNDVSNSFAHSFTSM